MHQAAETYLAAADPLMKKLIKAHGSCTLKPEGQRQPFESLVRAIAHQQLHANAAEAILARLIEASNNKFPTPEGLLALPEEKIRICGFSQAKTASLQDIARNSLTGVVPTSAQIKKLSDEDIVTRLTQIRGVGRWTVEMLLMFQLGRPDILPVDDFGIRHGFMVVKKLEQMPKPRELLTYGYKWQPHRTVASWYLWRAADAAKLASKKPALTKKNKS